MTTDSKTKYPIILIHGMGIRDSRHISSWGRIPERLTEAGFRVFVGGQDANGSAEDNAAAIKKRILEILSLTASEKINIIAHSKGGLDARYMITHLEMGGKVASLTTVSTPHNGSKTIDVILKIPDFLLRFGCKITDAIMRIRGDKSPKTYEVITSFSTHSAKEFNAATPDDERVFYQSYSFVMKHWYSDLLMLIPYLAVYAVEGKNDGLLTPEATRWGWHKGVFMGNGRRGVSHWDEVDIRRFRLTGKQGEQISDIPGFYMDIAKELSEMGF